jgi:WD40 repeat protein
MIIDKFPARKKEVLVDFTGHTSTVYSANFSPDGTKVVSGSFDNTAKIFDASTGDEILTFTGHTDDVRSVDFSPDGTKVVSGSRDGTAKVVLVEGPYKFQYELTGLAPLTDYWVRVLATGRNEV